LEELSYHILDLARNSIEAGAANLEINVIEDPAKNLLKFEVKDDGRGIGENALNKITDPFYTTKAAKKIGLGIPLLSEAVQACGGSLKIEPLSPNGTQVTASFPYDHMDRAPLGDLPSTISVLLAAGHCFNLIYRHRHVRKNFVFNTKEIRAQLGKVPLTTPAVLNWLQEYLDSSIRNLKRRRNN
jgi:hypothetical protein